MIRFSLLLASFVAIAGCAGIDVRAINSPYEKDPDLSDAEMGVILDDWFNCDECVNGQLRRVQELGNSAIIVLAEAYSGTAVDRTVFFDERCERINIAIVARGFPGQDCIVYKTRFQDNLQRRYERRAFRALVAIRTADSCAVIGGIARCKRFAPHENYEIGFSTGHSVRYRVFD